jgi:serine O-acetyltransferase
MKKFVEDLFEQHRHKAVLPAPSSVNHFVDTLMAILFPAFSDKLYVSLDSLEAEMEVNRKQLQILISTVQKTSDKVAATKVRKFYEKVPEIHQKLVWDAMAIEAGDPAAKSFEEVVRTYPGFLAISVYRIAHCLSNLGVPILPRILTEVAHSRTGIDIHPRAKIGNSLFIDHGTGIVIGETTVIGTFVKIYQGVTLGALSVKKEMAETKRHPTIEDRVVIYAGATILGGGTVIGSNSVIGGNVWITESVEKNSVVYHRAELKIEQIR